MEVKQTNSNNLATGLLILASVFIAPHAREALKETPLGKLSQHPAFKVLHAETTTLSNIHGPSLDRKSGELDSKE